MTRVRVDDFLVTPPEIEPLDLAETKKSLRFTPSTEDALISLYISMARQLFEDQTGLQLITATYARVMDAIPAYGVSLPRRPVQSVVSVGYDDGSPETMLDPSGYRVVAPSGLFPQPGRIEWIGGGWSATRGRIVYTAGFGNDQSDVPELIRGALLMLVGHFHKRRAETHEGKDVVSVPMGAETIMASYRLRSFANVSPLRTVI